MPCIPMNFLIFHVVACTCFVIVTSAKVKRENDIYWKEGRDDFAKSRTAEPINHRPRNIILFIGDGMSIPTVTAARVYKAQRKGVRTGGRSPLLAFEDTPFVGLMKTSGVDQLTSGSASTASAMFTGTKINSRTLGVDRRVKFNNCSSYSPDSDLPSIFSFARAAGLPTGIVTTTRLTHATPAATYAHAASRKWESDWERNWAVRDGEDERRKCTDIASQFLTKGLDIRVALGGGRKMFLPVGAGGQRRDHRNLLEEWKQQHERRGRTGVLVTDKLALRTVTNNSSKKVDHLLGIFADDHLPFEDERALPANQNVPSLSEMVAAAIRLLSRDQRGFLLLVEGGRIDHGHHAGTARRALEETLSFEAAFITARAMTRPEETLTVVTADHSHVFTIGGYASRGANVLGSPEGGRGMARDGKSFTILLYANGPGAPINSVRMDPQLEDTTRFEYRQNAAVPLRSETHGADDVALYAAGPMAHLFGGVREQTFVAHAVMFAACLGPNRAVGDCAPPPPSPPPPPPPTPLSTVKADATRDGPAVVIAILAPVMVVWFLL